MLRWLLICLTNTGISAARTTSTKPTIDSTQTMPALVPSGSAIMSANSEWKLTKISSMTHLIGQRIAPMTSITNPSCLWVQQNLYLTPRKLLGQVLPDRRLLETKDCIERFARPSRQTRAKRLAAETAPAHRPSMLGSTGKHRHKAAKLPCGNPSRAESKGFLVPAK